MGDNIPPRHAVTPLNQKFVVMSVSRCPTAGVAEQQQVAKPTKFIAGIGDDTGICRDNWRTRTRGDIDPVIV